MDSRAVALLLDAPPRISAWRSELDHRLSAVGSPPAARRAAADADRYAVGGTGGGSRWRGRCVQLAGDVRGGGRVLEPVGRGGRATARVHPARRISDGG